MADRFDRFTTRARKVLTLAQEEAQRLQHNYIVVSTCSEAQVIPDFEATGLLPAGIHHADWAEIVARFGISRWNARDQELAAADTDRSV